MSKIDWLKHEDLLCEKEYLQHCEERMWESHDDFIMAKRKWEKAIESVQRKERELYSTQLAS